MARVKVNIYLRVVAEKQPPFLNGQGTMNKNYCPLSIVHFHYLKVFLKHRIDIFRNRSIVIFHSDHFITLFYLDFIRHAIAHF